MENIKEKSMHPLEWMKLAIKTAKENVQDPVLSKTNNLPKKPHFTEQYAYYETIYLKNL